MVIEATQWFKNGDHPEDYAEERAWTENGEVTMKPGSFFKDHDYEGGVVRYCRSPGLDGQNKCQHCGRIMHDHGWIDTLEGGHNVCPGDWIIAGIKGERYPCKVDIFAATYEPA